MPAWPLQILDPSNLDPGRISGSGKKSPDFPRFCLKERESPQSEFSHPGDAKPKCTVKKDAPEHIYETVSQCSPLYEGERVLEFEEEKSTALFCTLVSTLHEEISIIVLCYGIMDQELPSHLICRGIHDNLQHNMSHVDIVADFTWKQI